MINCFSFAWIVPLQERVKKELPKENSSFLRIWSVISPILLYYLVNIFSHALLSYFIMEVTGMDGGKQGAAEWMATHSVWVSGITSALSMLVAAGSVFPVFYKETPVIRFPSEYRKDIPVLLVFGMAAALWVNVLFALLQITGSSQEYAQVAQRQFALPLWAGILLYGLVSPFAEELVFRGIVYNRFYRHYGRAAAIIGSSLLFGIYHGNVIQAVYGFLLGMIMAVCYERYASFMVPVLLHSVANISVYVMSGNTQIQKITMNWYGCSGLGILTILLFVFIFRKKKTN